MLTEKECTNCILLYGCSIHYTIMHFCNKKNDNVNGQIVGLQIIEI